MYWDRVAKFYDTFERVSDKAAYEEMGRRVARVVQPDDVVLECACGTGAISRHIAPVCRHLTATDFSEKMLAQAQKKLAAFGNVTIEHADITQLTYPDASFDKVVAGNVIHLLDDPRATLARLVRVCKPGGKVIVPTYIDPSGSKRGFMVKLLEKSGAGFKQRFDLESYRAFFEECGYQDATYDVVEGRMPCAIAVISVPQV